MAKRGRKPQEPYVTMWKEVVEGVRQVVKERNARGKPTVWHLYPTGLPKPYCGTVRADDVASERKAVGKFLRWKAEQEGTDWEKHVGDDAMVDSVWTGMLFAKDERVRDRRVEKLINLYVARYRNFIHDLILTDCRKAAVELEIDELAWFDQLKPPEPSLTLREVGDLYFNRHKSLSHEWKRKVKRMWKEFLRSVDAKTVRNITADHISHYHDKVYDVFNKGKSPTWAAQRFGAVKTIFSHALTRGKDQEQLQRVLTLCKMLVPPAKNGVDPQPFTPEHFKKLLAAVESEPMWKAIFLLSLNAALYPSEVAVVRKKELDLDGGTLVMDRGKTGIPRVAVLWPRTVEAIRRYQSERSHHCEYVFVSRTGSPYDANHIGRNFRRRREIAGLPESVEFAHIRDGAFTAAYNGKGVEEKHAKVLAGHRSGMTDHYVKRNPQTVAAACRAIEEVYFG
ncbi:MAG: tyrosine-type recombinase/integrase [Phycisphaerae bacterium]|nr:tyrosine-type recombinase/integrase [Phycisphaerae bacterium]